MHGVPVPPQIDFFQNGKHRSALTHSHVSPIYHIPRKLLLHLLSLTASPIYPSPPFFPLLSSPLFSSALLLLSLLFLFFFFFLPRVSSSPHLLHSLSDYTAIGGWQRPQHPYSTFNLSLISLHCNGKWFCVLLFDWSYEPTSHHCGTLCLGVGGVFNFAFRSNCLLSKNSYQ